MSYGNLHHLSRLLANIAPRWPFHRRIAIVLLARLLLRAVAGGGLGLVALADVAVVEVLLVALLLHKMGAPRRQDVLGPLGDSSPLDRVAEVATHGAQPHGDPAHEVVAVGGGEPPLRGALLGGVAESLRHAGLREGEVALQLEQL